MRRPLLCVRDLTKRCFGRRSVNRLFVVNLTCKNSYTEFYREASEKANIAGPFDNERDARKWIKADVVKYGSPEPYVYHILQKVCAVEARAVRVAGRLKEVEE